VPILAPLSRDEKLTLLDAFEEQRFDPGATVVQQVRCGVDSSAGTQLRADGSACFAGRHAILQGLHKACACCTSPPSCSRHWPAMLQGDPGGLFYIIKDGEAVVYQDSGGARKRVNQLFKADFFGEGALLADEPRCACRWTPARWPRAHSGTLPACLWAAIACCCVHMLQACMAACADCTYLMR
jgi:CRP-like cAMP-binding protein